MINTFTVAPKCEFVNHYKCTAVNCNIVWLGKCVICILSAIIKGFNVLTSETCRSFRSFTQRTIRQCV